MKNITKYYNKITKNKNNFKYDISQKYPIYHKVD